MHLYGEVYSGDLLLHFHKFGWFSRDRSQGIVKTEAALTKPQVWDKIQECYTSHNASDFLGVILFDWAPPEPQKKLVYFQKLISSPHDSYCHSHLKILFYWEIQTNLLVFVNLFGSSLNEMDI